MTTLESTELVTTERLRVTEKCQVECSFTDQPRNDLTLCKVDFILIGEKL